MNAPRALPTWSGPVGLADTNSTLTERASTGREATPAGRVGQDRRDDCLERGRVGVAGSGSRVARPRPDAIGVDAVASSASARSSAARAVAMASGAIRYGRASFIARLLAKSPWSGRPGAPPRPRGGSRRRASSATSRLPRRGPRHVQRPTAPGCGSAMRRRAGSTTMGTRRWTSFRGPTMVTAR